MNDSRDQDHPPSPTIGSNVVMSTSPSAKSQPYHILVADDSREIVHYLTDYLLPTAGFRSSYALDGPTALDKIRAEKPDLVLLDLNLPLMTGLDILEALRLEPTRPAVILITGYGSEKSAIEAFRRGASDYLVKPFTSDEVIAAVQRALRQERTTCSPASAATPHAASHALLDTLSSTTAAVAHSVLETIAHGRAWPGDAFGHILGVVIEQAEAGSSLISLEVKPHLLNPHGIAHGGVTYALADYACGVAAYTRLGSLNLVTQDMHLRYHGPARPGSLQARAQAIYKGTRTITTQCQVMQQDTLIASASATFAILSDEERQALV